jgi:hypothetical protein
MDDNHEAHGAALAALAAIENLQATALWLALPVDVQRQISRTHGTLAGLAGALEAEEMV